MRYLSFSFLFLVATVFCTAEESEAIDAFALDAMNLSYLEDIYELDHVQALAYARAPSPNPYIELHVWEKLTPFFLPDDHPAKADLDSIFSTRVSLTSATLEAAGFNKPRQRPHSHLVSSKHPRLKGYLVKLYTDDYPEVDEWKYLLRRIRGVLAVKSSIKKHGYEHIMKVPKKWIYPLPLEPSPPKGYFRKHFALIVEDMNIMSSVDNKALWKGPEMTKERMDAIYTVLDEVGLCDCVHAFNIPFCKDDMKIAFIDTEDNKCGPVQFRKMMKYLNHDMKAYLNKLIENDGPKNR